MVLSSIRPGHYPTSLRASFSMEVRVQRRRQLFIRTNHHDGPGTRYIAYMATGSGVHCDPSSSRHLPLAPSRRFQSTPKWQPTMPSPPLPPPPPPPPPFSPLISTNIYTLLLAALIVKFACPSCHLSSEVSKRLAQPAPVQGSANK